MELSEEEKKAIDYLKDDIKSYVYLLNNDDKQKDYYIKEYPNMEAKRILLNLVKKQQKEIEELKEKQDYSRLEKEQLLEDSISKDKIREKIKEYREETMRCQECKDYEDANINQRILLAFDKLLEE